MFVCLASVRDVYLGGLFQHQSPLTVAIIAFGVCSAIFLPIALARSRGALRTLLRRPGDLFWVNATSAFAWIAFFYALRMAEPLLVQILFSGIGPLSVVWIDRLVLGHRLPVALSRPERRTHAGLIASLVGASVVALGGLSGMAQEAPGAALLGVALAACAGISISANTVLCRELNDAGVDPVALVSVRFIGTLTVAVVLALATGTGAVGVFPTNADGGVGGVSSTSVITIALASLALIVFPIYVNQVAISLASPLTVRVVLAVGPVLIFLLQLADGRLSPSPYSLAAAVLYGVSALSTTLARHRAIRAPSIAP